MAAAMWACHLAGCIYTPVNASLPALSKVRVINSRVQTCLNLLQRFIFENTRTKFLLCSPSTLPEPEAVPDNVVVILIDVTTLTVLHPSLPSLPGASNIAPLACLTEQQLGDMKLGDMQIMLSRALNGRSTQPTDTGAPPLCLLC